MEQLSMDSASSITDGIPADPGAMDHDDENMDMDSGLDDQSSFRSTASLTASILDYRYLHGRTYQRSPTTTYWGPNDRQQMDGLDLTHHWMTLLFDDKLYQAPIGSSPQRILDIGTGTGVWAIDVADALPSAAVTGTDISPIQPAWVPPNCRFLIEDAQLPFAYPPSHFDLIHARHLTGCIDSWPTLYSQAFSHTKPGGYFEHCDYDIEVRSDTGLVGPDHVFKRFAEVLTAASEVNGRSFECPARTGGMGDMMRGAGFEGVVHRVWKVPVGGWPRERRMKQLGLFTYEFLDQSLEGFALLLLKEVMGWEYEEVLELVDAMRKALRRGRLMPYFVLHVAYGRKPG